MTYGALPGATTSVHAATRSGNDTILLLHGYGGNSQRVDCFGDGNNDGFLQAYSYLNQPHDVDGHKRSWGRVEDIRGIGYYKKDQGCDTNANLATDTGNDGKKYSDHCSSYMPDGMKPEDVGTENESIYHISCELAWYIYEEFGVHNWNVEIVAHSMGGLIIRNTIYQVWKNKAPKGVMPPTLGGISDVVTLATPHEGIDVIQGLFAENSGSRQIQEMKRGSAFMNEMQNAAQNPQAARGTDWSMIGTGSYFRSGSTNLGCDIAVYGHESTWMAGGRKTLYAGTSGGQGVQCYTHESILKDKNDNNDAYFQYSDGCNNVDSCTWNTGYGPHSLHHMWNALWHDNW